MRVTRALLLGLLLATPSLASAQTGFPTATLGAGDPVHITRTSGEQLQGVLSQISATELTLDNGARLTIDDVLKIDRRGDSVKNGATIGALVVGGWCAFVCGQGVASGSEFMMAVAANAGLGALLGAFIDHDRVGRTTVFRRSPALRVAPAITTTQRGLSFSLSF